MLPLVPIAGNQTIKHGQTAIEDDGAGDGLWLAEVFHQAWLNESHYIDLISNWGTIRLGMEYGPSKAFPFE